MNMPIRAKLKSERGIAWIFAILIVLIIILAITSMIPAYKKYQRQGQIVACGTALDTARRQLAANFMLNGFEDDSAEAAKEYITFVMNGWDDLCPEGGTVYIIPKADSELDWDIVCGLHCSDKKLCTRLNVGLWVYIPGMILGLGASFMTAYKVYLSVTGKQKKRERGENEVSFNKHI